uniref:Uncharacterized protein n=1 Tax=Mola mola TaxID=94237 RepID=A0A3Q4AT08_MOLML
MRPCAWLCTQPPWPPLWPPPLSAPIRRLDPKWSRRRAIPSPRRRAFPAAACHRCTRSRGRNLADKFIEFDAAPDKVDDGSLVRVRYQCSRPCRLAVEVVVSTLRKTSVVVFRRKWISSIARVYRIHQVRLRWPPSILYEHSFINSRLLDTHNVTVGAWLHHLDDGRGPGTMLRIHKVLRTTAASERPAEPSKVCPSWSAQLTWQTSGNRIHQCPHESDTIDMLTFPLASTGEHFGVVRRFQPFIDRTLERTRLQAVTKPRVTLSVWIYLLKWCQQNLCGIIHHVDRNNWYDSVLMLLTDTGGVMIQARVTRGEDEAFQANVVFPLRKWIRLDCYIQDSKVQKQKLRAEIDNETIYLLIHYDDTDGYFVIGGSKYIPGIHGYFGPVKYYRLGRSLGLKDLRTVLFQQAVNMMLAANQRGIKITSKSAALLEASSCFGSHKASLLLAALHLSGLAGVVDQQQGHAYSLIGAAGDSRLALMHAGYKHTQGIDGFPRDLDMAYSYYSNAGLTNFLFLNLSFLKQSMPEHIYLSNQEDLDHLRHMKSDVFEYLKFQAERGDVEAQKRLASMLYWGQHTVSKDTVGAVKWFERSAMQMTDPSAMYDYSILLMKGRGVKRNYTRGAQLLEKAAAMGSINALNGLGWYHGMILNDHENAAKYYEEAALNGDADGMFNLGIYHLSGKNPKSPVRNETAAFQLFLNAARFGHSAASVEAAWYLSTGCLEGVSHDVERAVIMLKTVCEENGHLGFILSEALHAYLQGSRWQAFVKYVLAAETGLGSAQSNAAHLLHRHVLLTQGMYNLAVLVQHGHPLPSRLGRLFDVSRHDGRDVVVEKILKRCFEMCVV